MHKPLVINLQKSTIYLTISALIYLLTLLLMWHYFYNIFLSIAMSIALFTWAYYFFPRYVLLNKAKSITKIIIQEGLINIIRNDSSSIKLYAYHLSYRSNFLSIITTGQERIIIFKDSSDTSLSTINRTLGTLGNVNN